MQSTAPKIVSMTNHVSRAKDTAADTTWSDIDKHLRSIERVADGLRTSYSLSTACIEALDVVAGVDQTGPEPRSMTRNIRRLQEIQRNTYSRQADDGIIRIAAEYIPAALKRVDWPGVPKTWVESMTLSAAQIADLARRRQAQRAANG